MSAEPLRGHGAQLPGEMSGHASSLIDKNYLGMICFLVSEAIFFGMLIIAYVYFKLANNGQVPNAKTSLDVGRTAIFTAVLLSSSVTIWFADRALARSNQKSYIFWLIITIILGFVFLGGQGTEYLQLFQDGVTISRNTFGTSFFTLTGFHGLHVTVGLIMLLILLGYSLKNQIRGPKSVAAESLSLYWHFVDVVWIAVFTVVYILA